MGKKTRIFTTGQLVYAKVKGYSPWPAKITKVLAKHKYSVYFYGTGEVGNCKSEELDSYDDKTRARFNTDRQLKKPEYKEAVEQIEAAASGNDPAPILPAGNDDSKIENNDSQKAEDISQEENDDDFDPEESQLQIAEDVPKSTPAPAPVQKKKAVVAKPPPVSLNLNITPVVEQQQQPQDTKENDEKVSRSGRKIKEKKMNNDEMDPDEVFTQSRKRFKPDEVRTKNSTSITSDSAINEFCISKMHILQDPQKKQFLTTQFDIMNAIQDIKLSLGLEHVEIDRALEACNTLKEKIMPNVDQLMLLKYSTTIITIKRLRNYIGNIDVWKLDEDPLNDFKQKAQQIRTISSEIYESFKTLFPETHENSTFFQHYIDEHNKFIQKYQKLDANDLFESTSIEDLETFLKKLTNNDDAQVPQLPESEDSTQPIKSP